MSYDPTKLAQLIREGHKSDYIQAATGLHSGVVTAARAFVRPQAKDGREIAYTAAQILRMRQIATSPGKVNAFPGYSPQRVSSIRSAWRIINQEKQQQTIQ